MRKKIGLRFVLILLLISNFFFFSQSQNLLLSSNPECTPRKCNRQANRECTWFCGPGLCYDYEMIEAYCSGPELCYSYWYMECWYGEYQYWDCDEAALLGECD